MDSTRLKLLKAKLKAAKAEERQWTKAYNQAKRAVARAGREIDQLEKKIGTELAKAQ